MKTENMDQQRPDTAGGLGAHERTAAGKSESLGVGRSILAPHDWKADFAYSGEGAIAHLEPATYDVLVTDLWMPRLTGADVLEFAATTRPDMVRIVLSGEVGRRLAERALPMCHEFHSKPCPP